jgi:hypothetical protein
MPASTSQIEDDSDAMKLAYAKFNALNDAFKHVCNDVNFVESIRTNYHLAQSSRSNQDKYLESIYAYLKTADERVARVRSVSFVIFFFIII